MAYLALRDVSAAEEVTQDAFLRAWQRGRWRGLERPRAWLARVAWRLAQTRRKALARERRYGGPSAPMPELAASTADGERDLAGRQRLARVEALIAVLPRGLREPLELAAVADLETSEIAALLGISSAAVRRRLMRARQLLRQKLETEEGRR